MNKFKEFLLKNRNENTINIFFDIETLQFNEHKGFKNPSEFKNVVYSFAISYFDNNQLEYLIFKNSYDFFELVKNTWKKWKTNPKINLISHNGNKYDNHFIRHDLIYHYNMQIENIYLRNADESANIESKKIKEIKNKNYLILEKRVKSSNNLELIFFLENIRFDTIDNFVKTNMSLGALGKKLFNAGLLEKQYLETDFDYTQYNKNENMTEKQARFYAEKVFNQLTKDELIYIRNDVIILAKTFKHYETIFYGFDYNKITFTSNILDYYNKKDLTSFQLLNRIKDTNSDVHLKYTDYHFSGENFYDYLNPFYRGGLNFYNTKYVGKILNESVIALDINSSYPYVMHKEKVPTYLIDDKEFEQAKKIKPELDNKDLFYLYRMKKEHFDNDILAKIESKVIRQMLVKYYSTNNKYININSYTLKLVESIIKKEIKEIRVQSFLVFETEFFGGRDLIAEKYKVKEQGGQNRKIDFKSPYDIKITDEKIDLLSNEEVENSKIVLNGLYGIPALRPYFNLFRNIKGELVNFENGFKNAERNIVFSIFVTSVALFNLLEPLTYLTQKEIDENFIYTDTDSLFLKKKIEYKLPEHLFHDLHLGKWSYDERQIDKIFVQNHKKYAYESNNKITVKSAGIPNDSFDYQMSFEKFIETQFSAGKSITNTKSIFNKQGTISIYESKTVLKKALGYPIFTFDPRVDKIKRQIIDEVKEYVNGDNQADSVLYIESPYGTFSMNEINPYKNEIKHKQSLDFLKIEHNFIKEHLSSN